MTARGRTEDGDRTQLSLLLRAIATIASVLVLIVSGGGYAAYHYFDAKINRFSLNIGGNRPADAASGTENFMLIGSDSRAGSTAYGGSSVTGQRSDTTILAHLDKDGTTTMVSFPRDTLVSIPGHGKGKLNSAIEIGGPSLLGQTIEQITGIRIDHFVSIDLAGFKAMTNAIGGVTVCVLPLPDNLKAQGFNNLVDKNSGWSGHVGQNKLNGDQALAFVRDRYGLPAGDIDRIKRQQQFIGAVFRKATSSGVLADPTKLEGLLSTATSALSVDKGTSINDLRKLATRLRGLSAQKVKFETIPTHAPSRAEGAIDDSGDLPVYGSVQIYDPAQVAALLAPLKGTVTAPAATATGSTTTVAPSTVTVAVLNGTTAPGLARTVTDALAAKGFTVSAPANATGGGYTTSQVLYAPGNEAAARTVMAAVPGSQLHADSTVTGGIRLIVGSSYTGVRSVTASGGTAPSTATPTPSGSASTVPTTTAAGTAGNCTY